MALVVKNLPANAGDMRCRLDPWVRKIPLAGCGRQPTPVFLPGESHGQRSLVGDTPWGHRESDKTEQLSLSFLWSPHKKKSLISGFRGLSTPSDKECHFLAGQESWNNSGNSRRDKLTQIYKYWRGNLAGFLCSIGAGLLASEWWMVEPFKVQSWISYKDFQQSKLKLLQTVN